MNLDRSKGPPTLRVICNGKRKELEQEMLDVIIVPGKMDLKRFGEIYKLLEPWGKDKLRLAGGRLAGKSLWYSD